MDTADTIAFYDAYQAASEGRDHLLRDAHQAAHYLARFISDEVARDGITHEIDWRRLHLYVDLYNGSWTAYLDADAAVAGLRQRWQDARDELATEISERPQIAVETP